MFGLIVRPFWSHCEPLSRFMSRYMALAMAAAELCRCTIARRGESSNLKQDQLRRIIAQIMDDTRLWFEDLVSPHQLGGTVRLIAWSYSYTDVTLTLSRQCFESYRKQYKKRLWLPSSLITINLIFLSIPVYQLYTNQTKSPCKLHSKP